ncbi:MAG: hypothetical protein WC728_03160 [Elusimicrobiota bacterium]
MGPKLGGLVLIIATLAGTPLISLAQQDGEQPAKPAQGDEQKDPPLSEEQKKRAEDIKTGIQNKGGKAQILGTAEDFAREYLGVEDLSSDSVSGEDMGRVLDRLHKETGIPFETLKKQLAEEAAFREQQAAKGDPVPGAHVPGSTEGVGADPQKVQQKLDQDRVDSGKNPSLLASKTQSGEPGAAMRSSPRTDSSPGDPAAKRGGLRSSDIQGVVEKARATPRAAPGISPEQAQAPAPPVIRAPDPPTIGLPTPTATIRAPDPRPVPQITMPTPTATIRAPTLQDQKNAAFAHTQEMRDILFKDTAKMIINNAPGSTLASFVNGGQNPLTGQTDPVASSKYGAFFAGLDLMGVASLASSLSVKSVSAAGGRTAAEVTAGKTPTAAKLTGFGTTGEKAAELSKQLSKLSPQAAEHYENIERGLRAMAEKYPGQKLDVDAALKWVRESGILDKGSTQECAKYGREFLQSLLGQERVQNLMKLSPEQLNSTLVGKALSQSGYKLSGYFHADDAVRLLNPNNIRNGDVLLVQYRVPAQNLGTQTLGTKGLPDGGTRILSSGYRDAGHFEVYFQGTSASDHAQKMNAALSGVGNEIMDIDSGVVVPVIKAVSVYRLK